MIRRSGARYLTDIFRAYPGMEVMRTTSTESNVNMRGYNDSADSTTGVMCLLDGRQVYNQFFGNVLWDTIPISLDDIEFIEIVRGPSSFQHGPDAMSGLFNIVTRSPLDYEYDTTSLDYDWRNQVSAAVGSYRSVVGSLVSV